MIYMTITTLPPEIRRMIYNLVIPTGTTIATTSCRRQHRCSLSCNRHEMTRIVPNIVSLGSFPTLSLVCQQIRRKVLPLFYLNRFLVANGQTGCPRQSNIQAIRNFTKFTAPQTLAMIKNVIFHLHFRWSRGELEQGELQAEMKTVHQISRLLSKFLIGLEAFGVEFHSLHRVTEFSIHPDVSIRNEFNWGIKKMMQIILKEGFQKLQYPHFRARDDRHSNLRVLFGGLVTKEQKDAGIELAQVDNDIERRA
ncbi:hypothetical protein BJ875DRAFT_439419 [Amylocarpus encephaloides]|uniref:F-box domain-containing protein n=1 Tax=Amylocarpus encephaloides TaxID=45428 RepID=A0A9P8C8U6_9HELO|nr:hypothetical protein BJ875DRAFT_439419 [Amylocarpus encephaloides]